MKSTLLAATVTAIAIISAPSMAAVIQYEMKPLWDAAAGAPTFTEDFEGFAGVTSFLNTPVALNQMTIEAVGNEDDNEIGPASFAENDVNGSQQANGAVNFGDTVITLDFNAPVSAWGAMFRGHNGSENLVVDLIDTTDSVIFTLDATTDGPAFLGFATTAGEQIASLLFRSSIEAVGPARESFGFDDVVGVAAQVPEPATLALFGLGLAGLGFARRRRAV